MEKWNVKAVTEANQWREDWVQSASAVSSLILSLLLILL